MMKNWKPFIRKMLLQVLKWTEEGAQAIPVNRAGAGSIFKREVHLPNPLVSAAAMLLIYGVLLAEIGFSMHKALGAALFVVTAFAVLFTYLNIDRPALVKDREAMMLLGLLFIVSVLLIAGFHEIEWYNYPMDYATPVAAAALLTAFLLSRRLSIVVSLLLCLILSAVNDFQLKYFYIQIFGCIVGAWGVPTVRNRGDITELGFRIAGANAAAVFTIWLLTGWPVEGLRALGIDILLVVINGLLSGIIVLTTLHSLEVFFSRTTNLKLIELADFNTPLLKRLMVEAPGTYHHSLIVASLAEQAAEAIGANPLLARVGAYYHDIGKLIKPEYFIENQASSGNPHDPLSPTMSSLVVISHVKEGIQLAKEQDVDKIILDSIEQHHGNSLIHYFYHRALEQKPDIEQESFRYPGPKPKTRETAILMLADAAEAACRALEEPNPGRIKDTVEKLINNKFTDGQFSDCPITLRDLSSISESMVTTLNGIYHARIEYKDNENKKED